MQDVDPAKQTRDPEPRPRPRRRRPERPPEGTGTAEAPAAGADTLKLAVTTGDGSTTDDRIPTPWYNRIMATNLMYRALFLADSTPDRGEAGSG